MVHTASLSAQPLPPPVMTIQPNSVPKESQIKENLVPTLFTETGNSLAHPSVNKEDTLSLDEQQLTDKEKEEEYIISQKRKTLTFLHKSVDVLNYYMYHDTTPDQLSNLDVSCPVTDKILELCIRQRSRHKEIRKEQMLKKVLNSCFKAMINDFRNKFYPDKRHLNEFVKEEFVKFFFDVDSDCMQFMKPNFKHNKNGGSTKETNLTYNRRYFRKICPNTKFKNCLLKYVDMYEKNMPAIFKKNLLSFLIECELWVKRRKAPINLIKELENYFGQRAKGSKPKGIKLPWTCKQMQMACNIVRMEIMKYK
jgi:hypothetical protein